MWLVVILLVVVVVLVVVIRRKKEEARQKTMNETEAEEVNKRFKEAAKNGADPRSVVGFSAIEKNKKLKNSETLPIVYKICMALAEAENGYKTKLANIWKDMGTIHTYIYILQNDGYNGLGKINFCYEPNDSSVLKSHFYLDEYLKDIYKDDEYFNNKIMQVPIVIESWASISESNDPWINICAGILKTHGFTYPDWLNEYPKAIGYINSML